MYIKLNLPQTLNCILLGTALGAICGVFLSIFEPEISQTKMARYGALIGLITSTASVSMVLILDRNNRG
ncbi:hypothetical protein [Planktothrix agardhii]|uniref:hypothetical protein n=1 Tax=Planktothrix agardhii TaxID=1160 RepID=UPI001F44C42B|nr:hypothetical protein [Planktothrix agardhii]MCF3608733.1 hypothetical protein [Planktothrix agardhii 1033]MEA5561392.1 hypothetical protein [Planktothrix agardhii UHCC 0887]